jgi:hypothetical protein
LSDINARADRAIARQARAAKAAERKKRSERLAYSVTDAADAIGRDPATIWRWIKAGALRASRGGGSTMIKKAELDRLLNEGGPPRRRQTREAGGKFVKKADGEPAR